MTPTGSHPVDTPSSPNSFHQARSGLFSSQNSPQLDLGRNLEAANPSDPVLKFKSVAAPLN